MRQRTHVSGPTRPRDASPRRLLHLILVMALALVSVASAQRVALGPLSIVVNPVPAFEVDVFLDRAGEGNQAPLYRVGEPVRVGVDVSSSAWVYLFDVGADGRITQILPNRYDDAGRDNFVTAGETKYFPPRNARYEFLVDGPNGLSKVFAVASKDRLDTRQLAQFRSDDSFAQSDLDEDGFARALGIVVQPVEPSGWVTDATRYWVGERPQRAQFGTISIRSDPDRAEAYVNGSFVGYTPVEYDTSAGRHRVEVRRDDFRTYDATVELGGGDTRVLHVDLVRVAQPEPEPQPPGRGGRLFENPALYAPAGMRIVEIERERDETEAVLTGDLDELYRSLHRQLRDQGWSLRDRERDGDSVEAEYRRNGETIELEIEREDRDRLELEIELEDEDE